MHLKYNLQSLSFCPTKKYIFLFFPCTDGTRLTILKEESTSLYLQNCCFNNTMIYSNLIIVTL